MTLALTSVCIALNAHVRGYHAVYEHQGAGYPLISISAPYATYEDAYDVALKHVETHLDTITTWDIVGNTPQEKTQ
jgi:hypothetical protein